MKTTQEFNLAKLDQLLEKSSSRIWITATFAVTLLSAQAWSQDQVLNNQAIDVDGYVAREQSLTDGELEAVKSELKKQQNEIILDKEKSKKYQQLADTNEKWIDTKEELIGTKLETNKRIKKSNAKVSELNEKMNCLFQEGYSSPNCEKYAEEKARLDDKEKEVVQQVQPAPVAAPIQEQSKASDHKDYTMQPFKVLMSAGVSSIQGEQNSFETNIDSNLRFEGLVSDRFALGLGFGYSRMAIQEFNTFMNPALLGGWYTGAFGVGPREIISNRFGVDLYTKFFLITNSRLRPYVGGGLGINRIDMAYRGGNPVSNPNNGALFGQEGVQTNYVTGTLMGGAEFSLSKNFGLNVELFYSRGLNSSFNQQNQANMLLNWDQLFLQDLSNQIIGANMFGGQIGIFYSF